MTGTEFLNNCTACGGNWTAMLMSGIKKLFPEYYDQLEDRTYSFDEIYSMSVDLGIDWNK